MIDKLKAFQARKSLGQNFLFDQNIARKIVAAFEPDAGEWVLEIGPGFGILTQYLLSYPCNYIGIEIDERLVEELKQKFSGQPNFHLIHGDFRSLDLARLQAEKEISAKFRIVGNIPYHITSSIIFAAFRQYALVQDMLLMVQREVAERITARPGSKNYSILSVLSQAMSTPRVLFHVSKKVFIPQPDVASSVVHWDFSHSRIDSIRSPEFFIAMVKKLFSQRRKTLRNSLKQLADPEDIARLDPVSLRKRIEAFSVEEMIELANFLFEQQKAKA
ncbi:MAG: ribosomal RNA small subunit methyltransferase A [Calditrichaeota bacterium]|nr:MAG: ribosomal RNA small subunit methyltransferase A [Calditrichota bacterium]